MRADPAVLSLTTADGNRTTYAGIHYLDFSMGDGTPVITKTVTVAQR